MIEKFNMKQFPNTFGFYASIVNMMAIYLNNENPQPSKVIELHDKYEQDVDGLSLENVRTENEKQRDNFPKDLENLKKTFKKNYNIAKEMIKSNS